MKYRSGIMITGDLLRIAEESGAGINHTSLLRKANLSHRNLRRLVDRLVSSELVVEQKIEGQRIYSITPKGRDYLKMYSSFAVISGSFGLPL
jgi:predicted transcriptional regulator